MAGERYVAQGLATARSTRFTNVARWATVGSIPLEFVKCINVEELRARLASGRPFSAVLVDAATGDVDRDLLDLASTQGASAIVIDDRRGGRDWTALGARARLDPDFDRRGLLDALAQVSHMIGGATALTVDDQAGPPEPGARGHFISVTGRGGTGASTIAMAIGQGLAGDDDRYAGQIVVADLRLDADLAMLHDARDIVPGVQELVEAHRSGRPSGDDIRRLTFEVVNRRYRLLLGLRRHRDWTMLRPRALDESLAGLQRCFRFVVADIDAELEGQDETGSAEIEERNLLARSAVARSDVVVVVGLPGLKGLHGLTRVVDDLRTHGVEPARILPVVNRAGRNQRTRAEVRRTFAELTSSDGGRPVDGPIFVPERRGLDDLHRDGARMPSAIAAPVVGAVQAVLGRAGARPDVAAAPPARVAPGSLGSWFDEEAG
jgi:MinD-like ATPase involved in chromosome partitioning or flagellar assembly